MKPLKSPELFVAFTQARRKIEEREKWASSYTALNTGTNCLSTALGPSYFVHEQFLKAAGIDGNIGAFLSVIRFNDSHDHKDILAALDRAVAWASS